MIWASHFSFSNVAEVYIVVVEWIGDFDCKRGDVGCNLLSRSIFGVLHTKDIGGELQIRAQISAFVC